MSYDVMLAITKNNYGECCVLIESNGSLVWDSIIYEVEDVYRDDFAYKPLDGKTINEIFVSNIKPLYEIEYVDKKDIYKEKIRAKVLIETEYSFLIMGVFSTIKYNKAEIDYEVIYEQSNLEYIDKL